MTRMRVVLPAVIALGSNQGDREATLRDAVRDIAALDGVTVTAASGLFESAALKPHGIDESAPGLPQRGRPGPKRARRRRSSSPRCTRSRHGTAGCGTRSGATAPSTSTSSRSARSASRPRRSPCLTRGPGERAFVLAPWLQVEPDAVLAGRGRVADLLAAATDTARPREGLPLLGGAR